MEKFKFEDKLITRIAICIVALLCIFFLFSCNSQHEVEPVTSNDTPYTTTDSTDVINNNTGLEEVMEENFIIPVKDTTNLTN